MAAKRTIGPGQITNAAVTKYTVPAGMRFIVRHIHVENPGAAVTFTMSIGADAAATRLYDAEPIPANKSTDFYPYFPVEAAEIIQAYASVTLQLVLTISGELEAV